MLGARQIGSAAVMLIMAALIACGAPSTAQQPVVGSASTSPRLSPGPSVVRTPPAPDPTPTPTPRPTKPPLLASDGRPREARLTIPALDLERLRVRHYRGSPDDARGTRIQNGGIAASPYGPRGGTGVGGIGNYIVTGHRTSSTEPFRRLPRLKKGAKVYLVAGGKRYTYKIVDTRITSFRSKKSLAKQSAPVPGRVGVQPTKAMITLSTCRTPEDHAEGNYWADRFDNPEHRIDKIGVLVRIEPA